jgi:hypothetical protein
MQTHPHPFLPDHAFDATPDGDKAELQVDALLATLRRLEPDEAHIALDIKLELLLGEIDRLMGDGS